MTFGEAIDDVFRQVGSTIRLKASNIFYRAIYTVTGISVAFTRYERQVDANCQRMRAFVSSYVQ